MLTVAFGLFISLATLNFVVARQAYDHAQEDTKVVRESLIRTNSLTKVRNLVRTLVNVANDIELRSSPFFSNRFEAHRDELKTELLLLQQAQNNLTVRFS